MNNNEILQLDKQYIANTYARLPIAPLCGNGATVFDHDGKKYIDFGSGIAVNTFGICDAEWQNVVKDQIAKIQHCSNYYANESSVKLAELLCKRTGFSKIFFSNSGAEANECAIKTARKYSFDKYGKEAKRYNIITLNNSFHGRTMATLSATGQDVFHTYFDPFLDGFEFVDQNDYGAVSEKIAKGNVCAVMLETVQGEGGVNVIDKESLTRIAEICAENDVLLIIDEVQTGNGRTGSLYSFTQFGVTPDIFTTAKGLAGGLPLGATFFNEKTSGVLGLGMHGSTFGGNPVSCAGALSVLSRLDDKLFDDVKKKSEYIKEKLGAANGVNGVSGMGLMLGIEIEKSAKEVFAQCLEKGLLALTAKTKIRLLPPLNISFEEIDEGLDILIEVLKK